MITVLSLGDGGVDALTLGALKALSQSPRNILQTGSVPCARYIAEQGIPFETLDGIYETAGSFDDLNARCARFIAERDGAAFGVLGDVSSNAIVRALLEVADVRFCLGQGAVQNALLAADICADAPVTSLSASSVNGYLPGSDCVLCVTEIASRQLASEVKLRLADFYGDECPVVYLFDGQAKHIALYEADGMDGYGYSACLVIPPVPLLEKERYTFSDFVHIMERLTAKDGCPWDREQTHQTLRRYIIEEGYEVIAAIDEEDMDKLYDELGDVLLQVLFHARIAEQRGEFTHTDVTTAVSKKMILRHPHIFGSLRVDTSGEVLRNWEDIKAAEKGFASFTDKLTDVPRSMSALMRSAKVQKRAATAGYDFADAKAAAAKVTEELGELLADASDPERAIDETGDLLFAVTNVARLLGVDPEIALMRSCDKFISRFRAAEEMARAQGQQLDKLGEKELDSLWNRVKSLT